MQCYTIFFITVNAVHVSGGFSAHHQELETVRTASGICQTCLLLPLARGTLWPAYQMATYTEWYIPDDVLIQLILLMMSTVLLETC